MQTPKAIPSAVRDAIVKGFTDYEGILQELRFDSLMGCYYFTYAGMFVGVELDGYIHT